MPDDRRLRYIAFYLPQFHPIAENDAWWGPGFTEWVNVARGDPLFRGHAQPDLPGDLGFYDLRLPETRQAQAALAARHGIDAFCYFHYWFHGRRMLERPFEEVFRSGEPDFPFCLCWANESWTRAWDGKSDEILIEQTYSREDDLAHIRALAEVFADPRYLRIDGRPVFLVYRAFRHPRPREFADVWRAEAQRLGIGEIYLCAVNGGRDQLLGPDDFGMDAMVAFAPFYGLLRGKRDTKVARRVARTAPVEQQVRAASHLRLRDGDGGQPRSPGAADQDLSRCLAGIRQLAPPAVGRDDHHRVHTRALRAMAPRRDRTVRAVLGAGEPAVRQRLERVGRGQSPRAVAAMAAPIS